jgi:molecular chaperone GrpE
MGHTDNEEKGTSVVNEEGTAGAQEVTEAPTIEELQKALEEEKGKAAANLAGWQRTAADFANYRKRVEQEKNEITRYANAGLIRRLLPVLDDLDRAFQTLPDNLADLTWIQGIILIDRKLRTILEQEGLRPMEAVGQPFDPAFHEAILYEETDPVNDGKVIAELQKGYQFHDKVLRPTLVKVGRGTGQAQVSVEQARPSGQASAAMDGQAQDRQGNESGG